MDGLSLHWFTGDQGDFAHASGHYARTECESTLKDQKHLWMLAALIEVHGPYHHEPQCREIPSCSAKGNIKQWHPVPVVAILRPRTACLGHFRAGYRTAPPTLFVSQERKFQIVVAKSSDNCVRNHDAQYSDCRVRGDWQQSA